MTEGTTSWFDDIVLALNRMPIERLKLLREIVVATAARRQAAPDIESALRTLVGEAAESPIPPR